MVENLWAPWRMQFIEAARSQMTGCIFCDMLKKGTDREQLILFRSGLAFVVLNKYPYSNGHLLIVPQRHIGELHELTRDEHAEMMQLTAHAVQILRKALKAEGINCGMNLGKVAGAGVRGHVHGHVVPRWVGDTNFLPVLADVRSLPEYLHVTYDRLVGEFSKEGL